MPNNFVITNEFEIPFNGFTPGQIIKSEQFNDNFTFIESKINEIINKYNSSLSHIDDTDNPHGITAEVLNLYSKEQTDNMIEDIKDGAFNEGAISTSHLSNGCVTSEKLSEGAITFNKLSSDVGSGLNISSNPSITNVYTKAEIDEKLGGPDSTFYSKEQIDSMFSDVQAGQILDGSIGLGKLAPNVGSGLNISSNPSFRNYYSKNEVNYFVETYGMLRDFGSITTLDEIDVGNTTPPSSTEGGSSSGVINATYDSTTTAIVFG